MRTKHYGEPLFQTRTDRPGILNEHFWAGLYRKEHDILFEPARRLNRSGELVRVVRVRDSSVRMRLRRTFVRPRKLSFAIVFFPRSRMEAGETTGFQKCTLRTMMALD